MRPRAHPFIVMEYLKGHTLKHLITGKPLNSAPILDLAIQIAKRDTENSKVSTLPAGLFDWNKWTEDGFQRARRGRKIAVSVFLAQDL
jgi:hypothetical protein